MHPFEIAFFRVFFGFFALAPVFLRQGWAPLRTRNVKLLAGRGVLNAAAMLMFFFSLSITPLATVAALSFTAPLFATLLAMLMLHETVRLRRWTAILIGFEIGRASCRERVCEYVEISVGAVSLKKKNNK